MNDIILQVIDYFKIEMVSLRSSRRGRFLDNILRWVAMFLSQKCCGVIFKDIASELDL